MVHALSVQFFYLKYVSVVVLFIIKSCVCFSAILCITVSVCYAVAGVRTSAP